MNSRKILLTTLATTTTLWIGIANADEPTFTPTSEDALTELESSETSKDAIWKAGAQAGLLMTTGNAQTTTVSAGAKASRRSGMNKLQLEVGGAFARSSLFIVSDGNGDGAISRDELNRDSQTTARVLEGKARYDRFLSTMNSLYIAGLGLTNKPAGRDFIVGGQVGYSLTAYTDKNHDLQIEVGYDYRYEDQINDAATFSVHSVRAFAGYQGKLSKDSGFDASIEGLFNLNDVDDKGIRIADRFEDARITGRLAMTTALFKDISFRFGFEANYDHVPAALPIQNNIPFANGFTPAAQELDTKTEASLIVNFL